MVPPRWSGDPPDGEADGVPLVGLLVLVVGHEHPQLVDDAQGLATLRGEEDGGERFRRREFYKQSQSSMCI